jgi:GLPGLI family protein
MSRYILLLALFTAMYMGAAAQYTAQGKIEFERKVNIHRQMEDMDDEGNGWFQKIKAQVPKFTTSYFNYYFTTDKAVYRPGKETENPFKMFGGAPASENIVYTDFKIRKVAALKQVYEEKFLVQDSMRKMEWKIMDEIRTIAGYKCRKAVGRICDSVYVVAFYSEDILASGGPEMFSGLPGMILEIAIPRLHSTWTATSVEVSGPKAEDLKAPEKGKKTTQHELYTVLQSSMSKWGKYAQRSIWWSML